MASTNSGATTSPPAWLAVGWLKSLLLLGAGTLVVWMALGADGILRATHRDEAAADLIARLHLTTPAYYPAGHPLRHPESRQAGIPARHTPQLPLWLTQDGIEPLPAPLARWEAQP
jgi:hypothetical protein